MASKQSSVKPLTDLFTVVIGISLTIALQGAVAISDPFPIKLSVIPALLAFLFTVLPFAHGAVTHLITTYDDAPKSTGSAALVVDYFILFVNGCIFIVWASLLWNIEYSTYAYMLILSVDAMWGFLTRIFSSKGSGATPSLTWAWINIVTFLILFLAAWLFIGPVYQPGWDSKVSQVVMVLALLRTILDYSLTWNFYIGRSE